MRCAEFYSGRLPDHRGRFLTELQSYGFDDLEERHDFIQWLFPLPEPSPVNPLAPVIEPSDIEAFCRSDELRQALDRSFRIMLAFYGFETRSEQPLVIAVGPNFGERAGIWLTRGNHNHLRITRILRSLRLLGLPDRAEAFFTALSQLSPQGDITAVTWRFWRDAVNGAPH